MENLAETERLDKYMQAIPGYAAWLDAEPGWPVPDDADAESPGGPAPECVACSACGGPVARALAVEFVSMSGRPSLWSHLRCVRRVEALAHEAA